MKNRYLEKENLRLQNKIRILTIKKATGRGVYHIQDFNNIAFRFDYTFVLQTLRKTVFLLILI